MKGYKNYEGINFQKLFEDYQKNNLTQTEISKKYDIPYSTFNSRYVKWKMQNMNGGGDNNKNTKIARKNIPIDEKKYNEQQKESEKILESMKGGRSKKNTITVELVDQIRPEEKSVFQQQNTNMRMENISEEKNIRNKDVFHIAPVKPHKPVNV